MSGFALFETSIGMCALAWGPRGLVGVQLPADNGEPATRARMRQRFPDLQEGPPNEMAQRAVEAIQGLLRGVRDDLGHIELDMSGVSEFHQRIYAIARRIPPASWFRFRHAMQNTNSVLLVLEQAPFARSCAALSLEARREAVAWSGNLLSGTTFTWCVVKG